MLKITAFSLLNFLCISRVSRLMAGWKYVCSASTISLTPLSKACWRTQKNSIINTTSYDVFDFHELYLWLQLSCCIVLYFLMHIFLFWVPHMGQNVHSLQHSLHLPLFLSCELVQQRLQLPCLHIRHTKQQIIKSLSICFLYDKHTNYISMWQTGQKLGGQRGRESSMTISITAHVLLNSNVITPAEIYRAVQTVYLNAVDMILQQQVVILWEKYQYLVPTRLLSTCSHNKEVQVLIEKQKLSSFLLLFF